MLEAMNKENPDPIRVDLKQKRYGWQTGLPITIGGIIFNGTATKDGFAYYTYGDDHSINSFVYASPTAVYETKDEGKTWYNITPKSK